MNCFQKSYLWLLNTTFLNRKRQKAGCELLSKILSLTIEHNTNTTLWSHLLVVNCFQKSYLWLLNTTCLRWVLSFPALWIAFKNLIFDYWTQPNFTSEPRQPVVNCFQKSYLWLLNTTCSCLQRNPRGLWIAFKNLIFDYWTQLGSGNIKIERGCELLSKILSLTIEHNLPAQLGFTFQVVNCFQKSYLWLLNTTLPKGCVCGFRLWIAFKNLIFDYWTQPLSEQDGTHFCCELLSKILSLTIEHNTICFLSTIGTVVNCFQKSYLWLLNTTHLPLQKMVRTLWIAFKNLIFDYWTQLCGAGDGAGAGCELLSKILSLTIEHNYRIV